MPYYPYSRQSKKKALRGSITARMLANLLNVAGVTHVITVDLHATQMQGFFKCPIDNLPAEPSFAKWIRANVVEWREAVVVSKNPGGTKRATSLADALKLSFGIVTTDQRRNRFPAPIAVHNGPVNENTRMATDGANDRRDTRPTNGATASTTTSSTANNTATTPDRRPREVDVAHRFINGEMRKPQPSRAFTSVTSSPRSRPMLNHGEIASSPLAYSQQADSNQSTEVRDGPVHSQQLQRMPTALGLSQMPRDDDGYEEPEGDDSHDELTRDVVTGRLFQGHIVDDDVPSPTSMHSVRPHSSSEDQDAPDCMVSSLMSTTSSRFFGPGSGFGGAGDATASDEEEEEALHDPEVETTVTLVGNVRGRPVVIIDDMIDKAGSWIAAAETVVKRGGATRVYCIATHALFGGDSLRDLQKCPEVEKVVVTNAISVPEEKRRGVSKLEVLDVSWLLAEAIRRNHHGESISQLFQHYD